MSKWLAQFRLEWKLLYSNWFFPLLPILYGVWFFYQITTISPTASQDLYYYVYAFHQLAHTLSLGVAMLLGSLFVRRDLTQQRYEWLQTSPTPVATILVSKFVVGFLYLSQFTVVMGVVYLFFANQWNLPLETSWENVLYYALTYEWSYGVTLALAMILAAFIRHRIVYLIGFLAWMFGTFFIDLFLLDHFGLHFLKTFHLSQFTHDFMLESEAWGYHLLRKDIWTSRIFVLAFAIMLIVFAIRKLINQRPNSKMRKWSMIVTLAVLMTIASGIPYLTIWQERYSAYLDRYESNYQNPEKIKPNFTWGPITSYDITVEQMEDDRLEVRTILKFPVQKEEKLIFTLNQDFQVNEAIINGVKVDYSQQGEYLTIMYPQQVKSKEPEEQVLSLQYEGKVFDWIQSSNKQAYAGFVQDEYVYLPSYFAWYPLPGRQNPYYSYPESHNIGVRTITGFQLNADFTVQLKNFKNKVYGTIEKKDENSILQIYQQKQAKGITLFAGNLIEVPSKQNNMAIITTQSNRGEAEKFLQNLERKMDYFTTWLPNESGMNEIIYIPLVATSDDAQFVYGDRLENDRLIIAESQHHNLDAHQLDKSVLASLFQDTTRGYYPDDSLIGVIRDSFHYLYLRDGLNLSRKEIDTGQYSGSFFIHDKNVNTINRIETALEAGKVAEVKKVLTHFYQQGLGFKETNEWFRYPVITMEDWNKEWNRVMGNE